jgi:hypothetical protein
MKPLRIVSKQKRVGDKLRVSVAISVVAFDVGLHHPKGWRVHRGSDVSV